MRHLYLIGGFIYFVKLNKNHLKKETRKLNNLNEINITSYFKF